MPSRVWTALAVVGLAAATLSLPATPASAVTLQVCSGTYTTTYDPGLTYAPQDVDFTSQSQYACSGLDFAVTSGSAQAGGPTRQASCASLLGVPASGPTTVHWNTGDSSTYTWTSTATQVGDHVVTIALGQVTAGRFLHSTVSRVSTTELGSDLLENACDSPEGLQSQSGTATLTILL